MSKPHIRWLYDQLPSLVADDVLTEDAAGRIRERYGDVPATSGTRVALTVFGILGATLIGAGVILLFAHNWQALSRPVRTVLAFAPLVIAQALGAYVLATGRASAAWRESIGTAITMCIAATIGLIGQTYHIPGNLAGFLFIWMLLTLPLVYVLNVTAPAIVYLGALMWWTGYAQMEGGHALMYWPLLAAIVPVVFLANRRAPFGPRASLLGWALCLSVLAGTGIALEKTLPGLWIIIYGSLLPLLLMADGRWFSQASRLGQRPLAFTGAVGVAIVSLLLTYEWPWDDVGWTYYRHGWRHHGLAATVDYVLALAVPASVVVLGVRAFRARDWLALAYGALAPLTVIGYGIAAANAEPLSMILFNAYLFALGILTLVAGFRSGRLSFVNGGMLILAALIVARFFDSDLGFVLRGIIFILIGIGFLVTNITILKRTRPGAATEG